MALLLADPYPNERGIWPNVRSPLLRFCFLVNERLTAWYGDESAEMAVCWFQMRGAYATFFRTMVVCNFVVPVVFAGIKRLRTIPAA